MSMMWWAAVLALLVLELKSLLDAQLTSPSEPACPGNRIIFVCHHTGLLSRWTITLPSTMQRLENSTLMRPIGSIVTFENDPGFNFELHILSNSPDNITSVLQVMVVSRLNGVTLECTGPQQSDMFTISSALIIDPPAAPSGVKTAYEQFTKTGATVNITWSTSRGADNYTVKVTPPVMPGHVQISDFNTTDTSMQLTAVYNVNYTINITAQNCAGSNSASTISTLSVAGCSPPPPLTNGIINEYVNGSVGATILFHCEEALMPAVCESTGVWYPNPASHLCVNQSSVSCSAPIVPSNAHIRNQSNYIYLEGTKVTFQCDNGSQALLTTTCHANGDWSPPSSELNCNLPDNIGKGNAALDLVTALVICFICSLFFFLIGISVGALCYHWVKVVKPNIQHSDETIHAEHPTYTAPPAATQPPVIYEEVTLSGSKQNIELEKNVCYGPI